MKKIIFSTLLLTALLFSCKFQPFLKYYLPDKTTHLPKFNKWDKFVGTSSNPLRTCYDITCYDWSVVVFPEKEKINSTMKIYFKMECDQDTILLDFQSNFKIDAMKCSSLLKKVKRKKDALFIIFNREIKQGEKAMVEISYHGKPVELIKNSTLVWKKDKNNVPWICTSTEGLGPHQLMPCKNLLYDESDSCFIRVKVPKGLVAVANGKLDSTVETDLETTYNWSVHNPINIYNISFNVGKYVKIEKDYKDITNIDRKIEIYSLDYNKEKAEKHYDQAPIIMAELEKLYGLYPWWNDGCKFIESCLKDGDCMEHQSAISMGDNYQLNYENFNLTIVHELSHEWWGNSLTGFDYADIWLHEGFATYSEALFIEKIFGVKKRDGYLNYFYYAPKNLRPILKLYDVSYKAWISPDDGDIYYKAAWFIQTLRLKLNDDSLFFEILKDAHQKFAKSNITTAQFQVYFNEKTNRDFTSYFDLYLKEYTSPILEFKVDRSNRDSTILSYKWKSELPQGIKIPLMMLCGDRHYTLTPNTNYQTVVFPSNQKYYFDPAKSGYYLLEDVTAKEKRKMFYK